MIHYFISDIHLYPDNKFHPGRDSFLNFLQDLSAKTPGQLWILGDLFDFWFEYKTVIPAGYTEVLFKLKTLTKKGWGIQFLPGNHDYWCGKVFERETGITIIKETTFTRSIGGKKILLAHGDGLGEGDKGYKLMKPVLRSKIATFLFSLLHPTLGTYLANLFSHTSKRILRKQIDSIPEYLAEWVKEQSKNQIDIVITGHTHCPIINQHKNLIHASLGDWISHFTYLTIQEGEIKLNEYKK